MRSFTADEAKRKFGELLRAADDNLVEISKHGRPAYVLMPMWCFETYDELLQAQDENRALAAAGAAVEELRAGNTDAGVNALKEADALMRDTLGR